MPPLGPTSRPASARPPESSPVLVPNGWGVSVIRHQYSYGGREGLFEIGILNEDAHIEYDNPVNTEGVIGWLRPEDVVAYVNVLASLDPKGKAIEQGKDV